MKKYKKLYEYDIPNIYPEIKKIVQNGQGDFKKFIKAFDAQDGDYNKQDIYEIRDALATALDKSGTIFSYDLLTRTVLKKFK